MIEKKTKEKEKKPKKSQGLRKWAVLSGVGFQMGATIFVCAWAGKKLDERYLSGEKWFTIGLVLFGVFASIYIVLKQIKHLND